MNVIFTPKVLLYFEDLIITLYDKGYFSILETSKIYACTSRSTSVDELVDDIKTNLPTKRHKPAPAHYNKYGKGMKYASFKKNRRTTWYAFFKTYEKNGELFYLVRYMGNNHIEAHHLYEG